MARNPDCWAGHNNLGLDFFKRGQRDEAIKPITKKRWKTTQTI